MPPYEGIAGALRVFADALATGTKLEFCSHSTSDASAPEIHSPEPGAWWMLSLPKTRGARPSNSAAIGIWPLSRISPFMEPRQEMQATTATAVPAQLPNMFSAATENAASLACRSSLGTAPNTAVVLSR